MPPRNDVHQLVLIEHERHGRVAQAVQLDSAQPGALTHAMERV